MFIGPGILIYIFKAFKLEYEWHTHLFPYLLYPCSEIALCSSIYMTVAIAIERFIGLCRPFRRLSTRPCPAKAYIFPVLIFSIGKYYTIRKSQIVSKNSIFRKTRKLLIWIFVPKIKELLILYSYKITIFGAKIQSIQTKLAFQKSEKSLDFSSKF